MVKAKRVVREGHVEEIEVLAKTDLLTKRLIERLTPGGNLTIAAVLEEWSVALHNTCSSDSTASLYVNQVKSWAKHMRVLSWKLHEITTYKVSEFVNGIGDAKVSTRRVRLAALQSFFRYCHAMNYQFDGQISLVKVKLGLLTHEQKEPAVRVPFTDAEIATLKTHLLRRIEGTHLYADAFHAPMLKSWSQFWYAALCIGEATGLRIGDLCCLEVPSWNGSKLTVWTDKSNKRLEFECDETLKNVIGGINIKVGQRYWFQQQHRIYRSKHATYIQARFKLLLERAKVDSTKTFHCVRHAAGSRVAAESGISAAQQLLGHSSPSTTQQYVHTSQ